MFQFVVSTIRSHERSDGWEAKKKRGQENERTNSGRVESKTLADVKAVSPLDSDCECLLISYKSDSTLSLFTFGAHTSAHENYALKQ